MCALGRVCVRVWELLLPCWTTHAESRQAAPAPGRSRPSQEHPPCKPSVASAIVAASVCLSIKSTQVPRLECRGSPPRAPSPSRETLGTSQPQPLTMFPFPPPPPPPQTTRRSPTSTTSSRRTSAASRTPCRRRAARRRPSPWPASSAAVPQETADGVEGDRRVAQPPAALALRAVGGHVHEGGPGERSASVACWMAVREVEVERNSPVWGGRSECTKCARSRRTKCARSRRLGVCEWEGRLIWSRASGGGGNRVQQRGETRAPSSAPPLSETLSPRRIPRDGRRSRRRSTCRPATRGARAAGSRWARP